MITCHDCNATADDHALGWSEGDDGYRCPVHARLHWARVVAAAAGEPAPLFLPKNTALTRRSRRA